MVEMSENALPENVQAVSDPNNGNYIMFTTFDGEDPDEGNVLDLPTYKASIKKMVTVMEYEYFQSLVESVDGDVKAVGKMMYLPQTIRKPSELPPSLEAMVREHCEDFGDHTKAIVRFFEFDKKEESYYPVDLQFDDDGNFIQSAVEEEE